VVIKSAIGGEGMMVVVEEAAHSGVRLDLPISFSVRHASSPFIISTYHVLRFTT